MKLSLSSFLTLLKQAFQGWQKDNANVWCAALAYFTVFSLGPLLLVVISIVGLIFSKTSLEKEVYGQIQGLTGPEGAKMLETVIQHTKKPSSSFPGTIIGIITLVLGAAGVFGQLQQMLNTIWGVKQKPKSGIFNLIRSRLLNISMIGVIAFLLLVSLIASTIIAGVGTYLVHLLPFSSVILEVINAILSFIIITVLFAFIMKILPDVQIKWKNVWIGSMITALLFTVGKTAIGIYIGHSGVFSEYGAAASLIVLLLWVYYSSLILFFGVEFTKFYSLMRAEKILPNEFSVLAAKETATEKKTQKETPAKKIAEGFIEGFIDQVAKKVASKKSNNK